jgi:hypothetical protein
MPQSASTSVCRAEEGPGEPTAASTHIGFFLLIGAGVAAGFGGCGQNVRQRGRPTDLT